MNKIFITILIVIIVLLGSYFLLKTKVEAPTTEAPITSDKSTTPDKPITVDQNAVIIYSDTGYSTATLNVKVGDTVTWKNNSSSNMWTASGMHPSHVVYSSTALTAHCPDVLGTAFDACKGIAPGDSWSFVFNKVGGWGYHNHLKASHFGKVIVE